MSDVSVQLLDGRQVVLNRLVKGPPPKDEQTAQGIHTFWLDGKVAASSADQPFFPVSRGLWKPSKNHHFNG